MEKVLVIDPVLAAFVDRFEARLSAGVVIDAVVDFSEDDFARRAATRRSSDGQRDGGMGAPPEVRG